MEILVALAILTIAILAALRNSGGLIDNSAYLWDKSMAHWAAMNKAAEIRLAGRWGTWSDTGKVVQGGRDFFYQLTVTKTEDGEINRGTVEVAATAEAAPLAHLVFFLPRPQKL